MAEPEEFADHPPADTPSAKHLTWNICSHGTLHIVLWNDDGAFGTAMMGIDEARKFAEELNTAVDNWLKAQPGVVN